MRQYTVLQSIVRKNIPELESLPSQKRKKVIKQFLDENLVEILLKVKLPDPISFRFHMIRERFLDLRRRKGSKRGRKIFNYDLWRKLYEAKINLKYNILGNSQFQLPILSNYTTITPHRVGTPTNTEWTIRNTSASSILKNINPLASSVLVSNEMQTKMATSPSYKEFVECINDTCESFEVKKLGFAEYLLHEKKDMENPKWEKIILDARFYDKDFEQKMEKWENLREIIDESIKQLKTETKTLENIRQIEEKFYINLII